MLTKFENVQEGRFFKSLALMEFYSPILGRLARIEDANERRDALERALARAGRPPSGSRVTFDKIWTETSVGTRKKVWITCEQLREWNARHVVHLDKYVWILKQKGYALDDRGPYPHLPAEMQTDVTRFICDRINVINSTPTADGKPRSARAVLDELNFPLRYDYRTPANTTRLGAHPHADYSSISIYLPHASTVNQFETWYSHTRKEPDSPLRDITPEGIRTRLVQPHQLRELDEPTFELSAAEKQTLGDQAVARYVHTNQFHPEEGRDLLFRRGIIAPLSTTRSVTSAAGRKLAIYDEALVMDIFDEVFEFRVKEQHVRLETGGGSRSWTDCKSRDGSLQFRLTQEGLRRATIYRQANPDANNQNYVPPPIDASVNSNPTFIACHEIRLLKLELLHLHDLKRTDRAAYDRIQSIDDYGEFVKTLRSAPHPCSLDGCETNDLTLNEQGEPLSKGYSEDSVRSPYADERDKFMCPMHWQASYIHQAQGFDSQMNRRMISFAGYVTSADHFSMASRLAPFLSCPFGCEGLYNQANVQLLNGDVTAHCWVACCLECRQSQRLHTKSQVDQMKIEAVQVKTLNGHIVRDLITPFKALEFVDARSVKCAHPGCVKLCILLGSTLNERLSLDGENVCPAHFIPGGDTISNVKWLTPEEAAKVARAIVSDPSPLHLCELARKYETLPRLLVRGVERVAAEGRLINVEGWTRIRDELGA